MPLLKPDHASARQHEYEFSPLKNDIQEGDRILAVDDEDIRGISAISVSKMLGSRSENEERRLTVLREIFYDQSEGETESNTEVSGLAKNMK